MGRRYRVVTYSGNIYDVEVDDQGDNVSIKLVGSDDEVRVKVKRIDDDRFIVNIGSRSYRISLRGDSILVDNEPALLNKIVELLPIASSVKASKKRETIVSRRGEIRAPLTGRINEVKVKKGDYVRVGDVVALMLSMKMIVEIKSDVKGVVEEVLVKPGMTVKTGDLLIKINVEEKKKK